MIDVVHLSTKMGRSQQRAIGTKLFLSFNPIPGKGNIPISIIQFNYRFRILSKVSEKKQLFNAWKVQKQKEERVRINFIHLLTIELNNKTIAI